MTTESAAYQRLQHAAAEASAGAGLLAMRTVRAVHWECAAMEEQWRDQSGAPADEVRATLRRIRTALSMSVPYPEGTA